MAELHEDSDTYAPVNSDGEVMEWCCPVCMYPCVTSGTCPHHSIALERYSEVVRRSEVSDDN